MIPTLEQKLAWLKLAPIPGGEGASARTLGPWSGRSLGSKCVRGGCLPRLTISALRSFSAHA